MPNPIRNFLAGHFLSVQPDGMSDELWAKRKVMRDKVELQARNEARMQEAARQGRLDMYDTVSPGPSQRSSMPSAWGSSAAHSMQGISPKTPEIEAFSNAEEYPVAPRIEATPLPEDYTPLTTPQTSRPATPEPAPQPVAERPPRPLPTPPAPPDAPQDVVFERASHDRAGDDENTDEADEARDVVPQAKPEPVIRRKIRNQNITSMPPWRLERAEGQPEPQGWDGKAKPPAWP